MGRKDKAIRASDSSPAWQLFVGHGHPAGRVAVPKGEQGIYIDKDLADVYLHDERLGFDWCLLRPVGEV